MTMSKYYISYLGSEESEDTFYFKDEEAQEKLDSIPAEIENVQNQVTENTTNINTAQQQITEIIAEGGEPNVIEQIQVNGATLAIEDKTVNVPVPTKTSELTNDSNYATSTDIPTKLSELSDDVGYAKESEIPTKVSELENDSGYALATDVDADIAKVGTRIDNIVSEVIKPNIFRGSNTLIPLDLKTEAPINAWSLGKWLSMGNIETEEITDAPISDINKGLVISGSLEIGQPVSSTATSHIISCYARGNGTITPAQITATETDIAFYTNGEGQEISSDKWTTYSCGISSSFANGRGAALLMNGDLEVCGLKLEEGSTATPWCPSYWDMENKNSEIQPNLFKGTSEYSFYNVAYPNQLSLEGKWYSHGASIIEQLDTSPQNNIYQGIQLNESETGLFQGPLNLKDDTTYTISCYVRGYGELSMAFGDMNYGIVAIGYEENAIQTINSTSWTLYSYSFTKSDEYLGSLGFYCVSGSLELCGLKIEENDRATAWCLSQWDVENKNTLFNDICELGYISDSEILYKLGQCHINTGGFWYLESLNSIIFDSNTSWAYDEDSSTIYYDKDTELFYYNENFMSNEDPMTFSFYGVPPDYSKGQDGYVSVLADLDTSESHMIKDSEARENIETLQQMIVALQEQLIQVSDTLLEQLAQATTESVIEVTLLASDWSDEYPYTQIIENDKITEDTLFDVGILYPEDCDRDMQKDINDAMSLLYSIETQDGCIVFKATELPEEDIPLGLKGVF